MNGFIIQLLWIILLLPIVRKTWNLGVKRYSAMGA